MMMTCKLCHYALASTTAYMLHFEMCHKANFLSTITCGFANCESKLSNLEKYNHHVNKFHQEAQTSSNPSGSTESDSLYKCAYQNCNFKSRSKVTLRSHHFWKHSKSRDKSNQSENTEAGSELLNFDNEILEASANVNVEHISHVELAQPAVDEHSAYDNILKKFVHMGLSLNSRKHVPDSTLNYIIDCYSLLLKETTSVTSYKLKEELKDHGVNANVIDTIVDKVLSDNIMSRLHGSGSPMRSYHMRKKQYNELFPFLPPKQIKIRPNENNVICKYHYIPLADSIKWMLDDDSVYEQYLESTKRTPVLSSDLSDIHSGTTFLNHPLFSVDKDALQIILYFDDVDVTNCIGPAGGTYKIMHVGYTLGNLHPWHRAKVDPLQLVMLCKTQDVSYFGLHDILEEMIKDLKQLEETGVSIRGKMVKAGVLVLLGDNLGSHTVGGFTEGFSKSKFFCRYCEESREEWLRRWYGNDAKKKQQVEVDNSSDESSSEDDESNSDDNDDDSDIVFGCEEERTEQGEVEQSEVYDSDDDATLDEFIPLSDLRRKLKKNNAPLRTVLSYKQCVNELKRTPTGVKGVVGDSQLNKLNYFHVVGGTPPCIHHDIFEGFAPFDLLYCIKRLSKKYKFSLTYLNRKIQAFRFKGPEKLDKPPSKFTALRKKVKGSAVQISVFLRFIPMLIGEKVTDKNDPCWVMILTLIEIVELITSPFISKSVLDYIDGLIFKYIHLRVTLFQEIPIRPKHHFFEHYIVLLLMFGSLSRCSTMRFESKHKFFKSELRSKKCLKNPTLSLATAHQRMQSSLKIDHLFQNAPFITDAISFPELKVEDKLRQFLFASFGAEYSSKLQYSHRLTFRNTLYEENNLIVTSTEKHPKIELCKIKLLLLDGEKAFACGTKCDGNLQPDMQFYWIEESTNYFIFLLENLKDYVPYPEYIWCQRPVVVLKHLYRQM